MRDKRPAWKKKKQSTVGPLEVEVKNNDIEQALSVLKNKMSKEGVLAELKRRRFAEKPSDKKRRKQREALKKIRKNQRKQMRYRDE